MAPSQTPQQTRHCIRYFMETPFVSLILDSSVSDVIRWCLTVRAEDVADWVADPVAPSPLPPRVHLRGPLRPVLSPPSAVDELCAPRHLNHSGGRLPPCCGPGTSLSLAESGCQQSLVVDDSALKNL